MAGNTSSGRAPRGLRAFYSTVMDAFDQIPLQMRAEVAKAFSARWREYTVENGPEWRAAAKGGTSTAATRTGRASTRTATKGTRRTKTATSRTQKMKANGTRRLSTTGRGPGRPRNITTQQSTETISPASESAD
jgi:hypothetical protein